MRKIQKTALVGGTVATLLAGGVAFAAWTTNGTGSAQVGSGHAADLGVAALTPVDTLYPTGTVTQIVHVTNSNPYAVQLSDITPGAITSSNDDCNASSVTADVTPSSEILAATNGAADVPVQVHMSNAANDDCKDATFTISYTAHGLSH